MFINFNIGKQYQHLKRYRKIAEILIRNGLAFVVDRLDLGKYLPLKQRINNKEEDVNKNIIAKRLRQVLQELGPTYIKLGQLLSTRADILPPDYVQELRKLQDKVEEVPFVKIEEVLIEELGKNYSKYFKKIEKTPQAAASIAQTHRAVLQDGTDVILKIQRPDIRKTIKVDLEIIKNLVLSAEERELFPGFLKPHKIVDEFRETIFKELNFKSELSNIKKFKDNFAKEDKIEVPEVYNRFSTRKILVLEEIKGLKLSEVNEKNRKDINGPLLARLGAKALMKQVLIDGFFHADPHPGNIFVLGKEHLAYIDFGMMGRLTAEDQDQMTILFTALLHQNIDMIVDTILDIGYVEDDINNRKLKIEINNLLDRYYGIELEEIDFNIVVDDIERLLYNFHIRMPEEFFLLFRAVGISEGVGYTLDPSFNMVAVARNFLKTIIIEKMKPENLLERLIKGIWKYRNLGKNLPTRINNILNKIIVDDFTIGFKHLNLEKLTNKIDIVSNRLSISMIISALIIGSSMILQTELEPQIYNIPLLGFAGYSIAGLMGLWLVISIFRSGKF